MVAYFSYNNPSSGHRFPAPFDSIPYNFSAFDGGCKSGQIPQSLILDTEKGELVKTPVTGGKKNISNEKAIAALKSHSEAERRRRERINSHLSTLRGLVPCREKMDKAALLAEVIAQVKELKKTANEAGKGYLIPFDTDEVRVEHYDDKDGTLSFKATICCDYKPELLADLRQVVEGLQIKMVKAEMSSLGGRMRNDFVFTSRRTVHTDPATESQVVADSIHKALSFILEKASSAALEYSPRTAVPGKRRRVSFLDSSSSSS